MGTVKLYTDIEQSKKLAKILPIESADMGYLWNGYSFSEYPVSNQTIFKRVENIPCWSLASLFDVIKDKCGYIEFVYLKRTYDSRANPLEDVYRLSIDIYDVYEKEAVDACVEMILKLNELKML